MSQQTNLESYWSICNWSQNRNLQQTSSHFHQLTWHLRIVWQSSYAIHKLSQDRPISLIADQGRLRWGSAF